MLYLICKPYSPAVTLAKKWAHGMAYGLTSIYGFIFVVAGDILPTTFGKVQYLW